MINRAIKGLHCTSFVVKAYYVLLKSSSAAECVVDDKCVVYFLALGKFIPEKSSISLFLSSMKIPIARKNEER